MPQKTGPPKTLLLATRVTPRIKAVVVSMSVLESFNVSEWMRNLVIMGHKRSEALLNVLQALNFDLEMDDNE